MVKERIVVTQFLDSRVCMCKVSYVANRCGFQMCEFHQLKPQAVGDRVAYKSREAALGDQLCAVAVP